MVDIFRFCSILHKIATIKQLQGWCGKSAGKQHEKIIERFLQKPKDFTYRELVTLLSGFGFQEENKGKTSGSRVAFYDSRRRIIMLDIPHPKKILKSYQINGIITALKEYGYIE